MLWSLRSSLSETRICDAYACEWNGTPATPSRMYCVYTSFRGEIVSLSVDIRERELREQF